MESSPTLQVPGAVEDDFAAGRPGGGASEISGRGSRRSDASPRPGTPAEDRKTWYVGMYSSYKVRSKEFKELFSVEDSKFIVDFSCAYNKDILHQGRMYLSTQYCCFYSNIFGWENTVKIPWKDVISVTKERVAILIPNAIQLRTSDVDYFFATFANRDATFAIMYRIWEGIQNNQPMSEEEVCQVIMCQYPEEDTVDGAESYSSSAPPLLPEPEQSCGPEELSEEVERTLSSWKESVPGSMVLERSISKPLDQVYSLLYSNSNFYFTFQKDRGSTELDVGDWEQAENSTSSREVAYNMKMNNPVGPKTCQVKELQIQRDGTVPGKIYCIDTEAFNSGVPYADSFTVRTHICAYREGRDSCKLMVRAEIVFKKDLWGFLKEKIETNAWNGIRSFYKDLAESLESYSEEDIDVAESVTSKLQALHGQADAPSPAAVTADAAAVGVDAASSQTGLSSNFILQVVIFVLCVTCFVNVLVLWRLSGSSGEDPATPAAAVLTLPNIPPEYLTSLPESDQEWIRLLRAQAARHHQSAQSISETLTQVSQALAEAEKTLIKAGVHLKSQLQDSEVNAVLQYLKEEKQHSEL